MYDSLHHLIRHEFVSNEVLFFKVVVNKGRKDEMKALQLFIEFSRGLVSGLAPPQRPPEFRTRATNRL